MPKPTSKELASLVCELFAAIRRNPSVLDALKRPESVRSAADKLLSAVADVYGVTGQDVPRLAFPGDVEPAPTFRKLAKNLAPGDRVANRDGRTLAYTVHGTPRSCSRNGRVYAVVAWADGGQEERSWPADATVPLLK